MTADRRWVPGWLKRLLTTPTEELSRWQYAIRFFLELARQGTRQLREDRASQMAAALSFRTIFGLVPVLIIAMLLFRVFGGPELFGGLVSRVLAAAKLDQIASPDKTMTLAEWAQGLVRNVDAKVSGRTIGVIGALVLAWAATGLLTTIERSFNAICRAPEHRSLSRRIPLYWTTITIGPVLLYLSFHFQGRLVASLQQTSWGGSVASLIGLVSAFLSVWVLLLSLYMLLPNTKMSLAATAAGSFVAAILWTVATNVFRWYVGMSFSSESSAFTILYGSLGLIPLFLMWVYFLWLVVLYGLEITVMLQVVGGRMDKGVPVRREAPPLTDPASVIPLVRVVADRFEKSLAADPDDIVSLTRLDPRAVELMLGMLTEDGVLHEVEREGRTGYVLARPPDRITTDELLSVAQRLVAVPETEQTRASTWLARFRRAQLELPVHTPLSEL